MIISANQPYFLPYIGYWQLIAVADVFLIGDDYSFIKRGWITRNKIFDNHTIRSFSLNVSGVSSNKLISQISLTENLHFKTKILHQVNTYYHKSAYFDIGYSLLEQIVFFPDLNLASFLEHSIRVICSYLDINTTIIRTSELNTYDMCKKQYRIFEYCKQLRADTYINSIGGQKLYDPQEFANHGITLKFLKSDFPPYKQFNNEFVPGLSILDAIMFCSKEQLQEMLGCYSLV